MDHQNKRKSKPLISLWLTALVILVEVVSCARQHHRSLLANEGDLVTDLPGQPYVSFRHYAGYVPVNKSNGRALFYWFFEAMDLPKEKPLVLWLNGGPGCSSVGYGATQEIGPFLADNNGNGLKFNPYTWNKEANMLFLESPIGVGFSYSHATIDYQNLDDDIAARDAYTFLCNWLEKFPEYRGNNFYMAGESYAGIYVPQLAELVYDNNNKNKDSSLHINLKGFLLGNPRISNVEDWRGWVDYAWSHAVISDETHRIISKSCNFSSDDYFNNDECYDGITEIDKQYNEIDVYSLYTSPCIGDSARSSYFKSAQFKTNTHISTKRMPLRRLAGYDPCLDDSVRTFYNRADVQRALHASDGVNLKNWTMVSGWLQEYEGLTFATFRGAGHTVPSFKPNSSLAFFSAFLNGVPLPSSR